MSVEKRKSGYCVRWRDSTGISRSKQVSLWRDAVALDGEMKRKKVMGELVTHEKGTIRLDDFWEVWWTNHATTGLTLRTREIYGTLWTKHIKTSIGSLRLRDLTTEHAAKLLASCSSQLAPSSSRKVLAILQGVLERAVEWGYIPTNPAKGVRKPRLVQRRGRALTAEQVGAICKELDFHSEMVVQVLANTGMRPGELRALTWSELDEPVIYVLAAISDNQRGPTKTNSDRSVEALPAVWSLLRTWELACGRPAKFEFIFPGRGGGVWTDQGWRMWQRQVFKPATERAGLAGVVPYDLRHTFASTLIAQGRDIYWVARQLGHAPTMTLSTYGHLFESNYQGSRDERDARHRLQP